MGYAVDYKPTKARAKRNTPQSKAQRTKDIKQAIRWNVDKLEHDTFGTENIDRLMAQRILRFDRIAAKADPDGRHVMQELISRGVLLRPTRIAGREVFNRADLLVSLKTWAGVL